MPVTLTGTIHYVPVGTGAWSIVTDDGTTYEIYDGSVDILQQDGLRVKVSGAVRSDVMSFAMIGPIFEVESFTILENVP